MDTRLAQLSRLASCIRSRAVLFKHDERFGERLLFSSSMIGVAELSQRILEGASHPHLAGARTRLKSLLRPLIHLWSLVAVQAGIKDNPSAPEGDRAYACQKIALTPLDDGKAEL